jgi:hypothetical protein
MRCPAGTSCASHAFCATSVWRSAGRWIEPKPTLRPANSSDRLPSSRCSTQPHIRRGLFDKPPYYHHGQRTLCPGGSCMGNHPTPREQRMQRSLTQLCAISAISVRRNHLNAPLNLGVRKSRRGCPCRYLTHLFDINVSSIISNVIARRCYNLWVNRASLQPPQRGCRKEW